MKRYVKLAFGLLILVGIAAACSNGGNEEPKDEKEPAEKEETPAEGNGEPITKEQFPEEFLAGNFEKIYNQTSDSFQGMVTLDQFSEIGKEFNEGVESYGIVSDMPFQGVTEAQWLSDGGDKGIRVYFGGDGTIEGLQVLSVTSNQDSDDTYTENTYQMPINEEWLTFWGGTNELVNYHYPLESQRYSYDLVIAEDGHSFDGDAADNESYFAFGKDVVAPLGGTVVSLENDIEDNTPTVDTNTENPLGNHVIIEHENGEYSFIAHFKQGSILVTEGDEVNAGDLLGHTGNSGNSSEPHIHFHVGDSPDWQETVSLRIKFENGEEPVRGDAVTGFE